MQSTNFQHLQNRWPQLYEHANSAEQYVHTDPHTAIIKLRCFAEQLVGILYREFDLPCERNDGFFEKIKSSVFLEVVDKSILEKLNAIRILGNKALHEDYLKSSDEALALLREAYLIGQWIFKTYSGITDVEYPSYIEPIHPDVSVNLLNDEKKELEANLQGVKEELSRLQESERLAQNQAIELQSSLDKAKLQDLKEASSKAASSFNLAPENTRELIKLHDAFSGDDLTDGQNELVDRLASFLDSKDDLVFLVKGYAGTGKTFITRGITEYFRAVGRNFVLAAPTGKASKVLTQKTQCTAYTIHKSIYSFEDIAEYREDNLDGSQTYKYYFQLLGNDCSVDTVFIIDEASMVSDVYNEEEFFRFGSGHLLQDFFKFVNLDHNDHKKKVIFIGDNAQLPPVGMAFSPALDEKYLYREHNIKSVSFELTEVVRQKADSGVIHNSKKLRKSLNDGIFNQLTIDFGYPDVEEVSHEKTMNNYLESCGGKINDESIVIAHTNAEVAAYNRRIRKYFFPNLSEITHGDKVMVVSNSNAYGFFIYNGDFCITKEILSSTECRDITLRSKDKESNKVKELTISLKFREVLIEFKEFNDKVHLVKVKIIENLLYSDYPKLSSDERKALYIDFCIRHPQLKPNSLEFKETLKSDPYFNALRVKFGYAITCHKSQGSEWNHVFVDCKTHLQKACADYFRWLYTAMTRTSNKLYLMDPPSIEPWIDIEDVDDPTNVPTDGPLDQNSSSQNSTKDIDTTVENLDPTIDSFGIPSNAGFSLEILRRIKELIGKSDIKIQSVRQVQYQEIYFFQKGNEISRVDINYSGKGKIKRVIATPKQTELSLEIDELISPLENELIILATGPIKPLINIKFPEEFLKDFHEALDPLVGQKGITITNVKALEWKQRYTFTQPDKKIAVFDFHYTGKKQIKKKAPVKSLCNSESLIAEIRTIIKEELI